MGSLLSLLSPQLTGIINKEIKGMIDLLLQCMFLLLMEKAVSVSSTFLSWNNITDSTFFFQKVELKVSVNCCDGCKKKVKKVLQSIEGNKFVSLALYTILPCSC